MNLVEWHWVGTDDGERLRAFTVGPPAGEPVLLITGGGSAGRAWRFVVPELEESDAGSVGPSLAARLRVAGYDQRGTGSSSGRVPPESSRLASEHARSVGKAVLGERFHVVGHSLGGMAALQLALGHPDTVASLVVMATSSGGAGLTMPDPAFLDNITGGGDVDAVERARQNLALSFSSGFPERHPQLFTQLVDEIVAQPASPDSWVAQARTFASHDVTAALPRLRTPTLVICGTEDKVMPLTNSRYLADHIPGATLVELDHVGHALDVEATDEVVNQISTHITNHPLR